MGTPMWALTPSSEPSQTTRTLPQPSQKQVSPPTAQTLTPSRNSSAAACWQMSPPHVCCKTDIYGKPSKRKKSYGQPSALESLQEAQACDCCCRHQQGPAGHMRCKACGAAAPAWTPTQPTRSLRRCRSTAPTSPPRRRSWTPSLAATRRSADACASCAAAPRTTQSSSATQVRGRPLPPYKLKEAPFNPCKMWLSCIVCDLLRMQLLASMHKCAAASHATLISCSCSAETVHTVRPALQWQSADQSHRGSVTLRDALQIQG